MLLGRIVEEVVRTDGRRVLAGLIRLTGDFDSAEDALQEAYARALIAWHRDGVPATPGAWLNTVARRIAIDRLRRNRHTTLPDDVEARPVEVEEPHEIDDDRLRLLFTCCHPALAPEAQCALALRTLGGLTTREIARAFVEPEPTTAQRLVRAKRKIREAGIPFEVPALARLPERIETVLGVLYLIFNEGYAATDDDSLLRPDLMAEATRLARLSVELLPADAEARGLLALMLLTDARRAARTTANGDLVPLDDQDRSLWNRAQIEEGVRILDDALAMRRPGSYQTQAAIAALHSTAATPGETDWRQISALYQTLLRQTPTPVIELNLAVALGLSSGLSHALDGIARIEARGDLARYHLLPAAKADVLRRMGRPALAAESYRAALALVTNPAEKRYLERRLAECDATGATPTFMPGDARAD
jgi:RNA polymerase sigma-70 factor, ECF subfamily